MIIPNVIEERQSGTVTLDLFSRLYKDERIIFVFGTINETLAESVIMQLIYLDSISNEDITLYINSPGGVVNDGLAIYDTMNYIKSDVRTVCVGLAASMASILLAGGTKGKRFALQNSEIMIHQPLGGIQGQAVDIKIVADHIIKTRNLVNEILANATGKNITDIEKDTDRDYFMRSTEALNYGIIDHIIENR